MIYKSKKASKAVNKICVNVMTRKSIYFRRNLCINGVSTKIKIIKIKDKAEDFIYDLDQNSKDVCLLLEHTSKIILSNLKTDLDIIGTDYYDKVLVKGKLFANQENLINWTKQGVRNIWLFKLNYSRKLFIRINSTLSTKEAI